MKKKPTYKPMSRKQVQRLVNLVRGVMKILSKQMVDMENAIGVDTWYQTMEGPVRALTYGFENPEITPLLVNIHGNRMDTLALILSIVGSLNWGLVGIFQFDLVAWLFGGSESVVSRIIYTVIGLAGLWCISLLFRRRALVEGE